MELRWQYRYNKTIDEEVGATMGVWDNILQYRVTPRDDWADVEQTIDSNSKVKEIRK